MFGSVLKTIVNVLDDLEFKDCMDTLEVQKIWEKLDAERENLKDLLGK